MNEGKTAAETRLNGMRTLAFIVDFVYTLRVHIHNIDHASDCLAESIGGLVCLQEEMA